MRHPARHRRQVAAMLAASVVLVASACSASSAPVPSAPDSSAAASPAVAAPREPVTLLTGNASELALQASAAVWRSAPTVVVAPAGNRRAIVQGEDLAVGLGAPLLLGPVDDQSGDGQESAPSPLARQLADELTRLGTQSVVIAGGTAPVLPSTVRIISAADASARASDEDLVMDDPAMVVLTASGARTAAAAATLEAAGGRVIRLDGGGDPRSDPAAIDVLSAAGPVPVVAVGARLGPLPRLEARLATARTGVTLPGGRQTLFPGQRLVAIYGHPLTEALGVLGEQDPERSVQRVRRLASSYQAHSDEPVVPAFEIIATVASNEPGPDGDYSNETPVEVLRPYVDAAAAGGVYVVLDLQPGRSDFLSQAKEYEELLRLPHVGLALDPEWRLLPGQRHLEQIGTVDTSEVNRVITWLAGLVRSQALPQKMLLLHQFQPRMITTRGDLDTSRDEIAVVAQMDGDGTPAQKLATWRAIRADAPRGLRFGWKNFYDEDEPTFSPRRTMSVPPTPWWVSYQ